MEPTKGDGFLRAVKIFNVVAGILLVVGTATLVGTLIIRASGDRQPDGGSVPQASRDNQVMLLPVPQGSRIVDSTVDGETVLLILETPDDAQLAVAVQLGTGRITTLSPGGDVTP